MMRASYVAFQAYEVQQSAKVMEFDGRHGRARIRQYGHSVIQTLRHSARDSFMLLWGHCGLYLESGDERKTLMEPEQRPMA